MSSVSDQHTDNLLTYCDRVLPSLSDRSTKQCRATAYRLIRHSLVDVHSVERLQEQKLDWYIVKYVRFSGSCIPLTLIPACRSLARDNKHAVEKEQVIKLIRAIVEIGSQRRIPGSTVGSGVVPLSNAIMRALLAVAESLDDPFRLISIQTLTEICQSIFITF